MTSDDADDDEDDDASDAYSVDVYDRETALDVFDEFAVVIDVLGKLPQSLLLGCFSQNDIALWNNLLVANLKK